MVYAYWCVGTAVGDLIERAQSSSIAIETQVHNMPKTKRPPDPGAICYVKFPAAGILRTSEPPNGAHRACPCASSHRRGQVQHQFAVYRVAKQRFSSIAMRCRSPFCSLCIKIQPFAEIVFLGH